MHLMADAAVASGPYEIGLERNPANYEPLSPLSFLKRAARVHPEHIAQVHGAARLSWGETYERCRRLASALHARGIGRNDTVSILSSNIPAMFEAHYGAPMAGAVLNAIDTRLDAASVAFILDHSESRLLLVSRDFLPLAETALSVSRNKPPVVLIEEEGLPADSGYERLLAAGDPAFAWKGPEDEWQAIALSYTSGTTGTPKGVVTHHRGAYLNALGNALAWAMGPHPVYLWTLPMFHCNGWCFPWTLAAVAGTSVSLRRVSADAVHAAVAGQGVTHLCAPPAMLELLAGDCRAVGRRVHVMAGGAALSAAMVESLDARGFDVAHAYGLAEVYGPSAICAWKDGWNGLPAGERARLRTRQGVPYPVQEDMAVVDPATLRPVPADGATIGEIVMRGNAVMKGYFKNPTATGDAFAGGWFHTGDLGVLHPDGYVQLKDRSKDIIVSCGETVSSLEVEEVLHRHPGVLEAAVVACPDEFCGARPCAFVTPRDGAAVTEDDLVQWCRERLSPAQCPRTVVFTSLPKTSTGKIQKFALRKCVAALTPAAPGRPPSDRTTARPPAP